VFGALGRFVVRNPVVGAIGTDDNILMIARLREEAAEGNDPRTAADLAVEHAGRTGRRRRRDPAGRAGDRARPGRSRTWDRARRPGRRGACCRWSTRPERHLGRPRPDPVRARRVLARPAPGHPILARNLIERHLAAFAS
jgi:hypothetical protein